MSVNNEFNLGVSEKISDSISNSSIGLNSQVSALDSGSVNKPLFDAETLAANVIEKKKEDKKQAEKKDIEKKNTNTSMSEKNKNQDSGTISSIIESLTSFFSSGNNDKERLAQLKQQAKQQDSKLQILDGSIDVAQFEAITNSTVPHSDILKAKARTKENQAIDDKTRLDVNHQNVNDDIQNLKSKGVKL